MVAAVDCGSKRQTAARLQREHHPTARQSPSGIVHWHTRIVPSLTALIVIDLQVGVLAGCFDAAAILNRTANLVDRTQAEGVPVSWVQAHDNFLDAGRQRQTTKLFIEGEAAWTLAPPLTQELDKPGIENLRRRSQELGRSPCRPRSLADRIAVDEPGNNARDIRGSVVVHGRVVGSIDRVDDQRPQPAESLANLHLRHRMPTLDNPLGDTSHRQLDRNQDHVENNNEPGPARTVDQLQFRWMRKHRLGDE